MGKKGLEPSSSQDFVGEKVKLESQNWPRPRNVEVLGIDEEDLVVRIKGDPPHFGEVVQFRAPGVRGAKVVLTGEVVILERVREGGSGTKVTVQLVEGAHDALTRLLLKTPVPKPVKTPVPKPVDPGDTWEMQPDEISSSTTEASPQPEASATDATALPTREPTAETKKKPEPAVSGSYSFTPEGGRGWSPRAKKPSPARKPKGKKPARTKPKAKAARSDAKDLATRPTAPDPGQASKALAEDDRKTPPASAFHQDALPISPGDELELTDELPLPSRDAQLLPHDISLSFDDDIPLELDDKPLPLGDAVPTPANALLPRETPQVSSVKTNPGLDAQEAVRQISSRASTARRSARVQSGEAAPVVGIDFGTTYSKVALLDHGEVVLIEDEKSYSATRAAVPSVIAIGNDGGVLVGEAAREMLVVKPQQVITSVKRVLGLRYSDPLANGLLGTLACPSVAGPNDSILFDIAGKQLTVPEVVSRILEHIVGMASNWAGSKVTKAVLTYPVDFDALALRELELAAKMIGLEIVAMVPEPVAAVMGCGIENAQDSVIAVYDFGGGTFDASLVEASDKKFNVLGSAGDRWLGGDDLDELLARHAADKFWLEKDISLHNRREEFQRLLFACEETKRLLSALDKVDVILPNAGLTSEGQQVLLVPVDRKDFEELTMDVIASSLEICKQAADEAGKDPSQIDSLLLTGGTSRVPVVRVGAERYFGRPGVTGIHPEHAVVIGAAVRAAVAAGGDVPSDIGNRLKDDTLPGWDVSIINDDGMVEPVFEASAPPPATAHRFFCTSIDGQTKVRLELAVGKSEIAEQNRSIGGFVIDGLPARSAGETALNIYFELGSTGTLYVTAQDRASGKRAQATFDLSEE